MILPILLALLLLLESSQSLRRATMRLLRCLNQEQKISAILGNIHYLELPYIASLFFRIFYAFLLQIAESSGFSTLLTIASIKSLNSSKLIASKIRFITNELIPAMVC